MALWQNYCIITSRREEMGLLGMFWKVRVFSNSLSTVTVCVDVSAYCLSRSQNLFVLICIYLQSSGFIQYFPFIKLMPSRFLHSNRQKRSRKTDSVSKNLEVSDGYLIEFRNPFCIGGNAPYTWYSVIKRLINF